MLAQLSCKGGFSCSDVAGNGDMFNWLSIHTALQDKQINKLRSAPGILPYILYK
jgi:hypothetical protein